MGAVLVKLREFHRPHDVAEALRLLARPGVRTRPLAGGTLVAGRRDAETEALVDLSGLGLRYVREGPGEVAIGALTTLAGVLESRAALLGGGVVAEAIERTGPPSLLQRATVGGALARADRAGELVTAFLALDARLALLRAGAEREEVPLEAWLARNGRGEDSVLIEEVRVSTRPVAVAYERVARTPRDVAIVAIVAALRVEGGICREPRLAAWGAAPGPVRLASAEAWLSGRALDDEALRRAAGAAASSDAIRAPDDIRGSRDYRRHLTEVLVRRALAAARQLASAP